MSATTRILLALLLAGCSGLVLALSHPPLAVKIAGIIQPIGQLWLHALQMTVVPLVATLIILGVNTASDALASGRIARNTLLVFILLLSIAAGFVALFAPFLFSFLPRDPSTVEALRGVFASAAADTTTQQAPSLATRITQIIPTNAIAAAANNAMLPLVVFCLLFGFALSRIEADLKHSLLTSIKAIGEVMVVIVRWVLWLAPVGVFALVFSITAQVGLDLLKVLAWYVLVMCVIFTATTLLMYVLAKVLAKESLRRFAVAVAPAQSVAASTQSSLASLPAMVQAARERLGYPLSVTSLVLPMAVSLFRINSPAQYLGVAAFIAWAYGVDVSATQMAIAAALAVVVSMGAIGLPGQVSFMATNMPVVQSLGLPVAPLGVLLALETIPDAFATVGNVTANVAATGIVSRFSKASDTQADADNTNAHTSNDTGANH